MLAPLDDGHSHRPRGHTQFYFQKLGEEARVAAVRDNGVWHIDGNKESRFLGRGVALHLHGVDIDYDFLPLFW